MTPGGAVLDLFGGNAIPTFGPKPIAQNLGTTCSARPEGKSGGPRQTALLQTMKGARRLCRGALSNDTGPPVSAARRQPGLNAGFYLRVIPHGEAWNDRRDLPAHRAVSANGLPE